MIKSKNLKFIRSLRCLVCEKRPVDVCHIKSRGSGGTDEMYNLMPLCRDHHIEQHKIGIITFFKKYSTVNFYMKSIGWYEENNKLRNSKTENA